MKMDTEGAEKLPRMDIVCRLSDGHFPQKPAWRQGGSGRDGHSDIASRWTKHFLGMRPRWTYHPRIVHLTMSRVFRGQVQ